VARVETVSIDDQLPDGRSRTVPLAFLGCMVAQAAYGTAEAVTLMS
jgi:hypothetical protein